VSTSPIKDEITTDKLIPKEDITKYECGKSIALSPIKLIESTNPKI
jgi:hypothetical protein